MKNSYYFHSLFAYNISSSPVFYKYGVVFHYLQKKYLKYSKPCESLWSDLVHPKISKIRKRFEFYIEVYLSLFDQ